jgi:hypothetical protein
VLVTIACVITQSNGAESIVLLAGGIESMMLSAVEAKSQGTKVPYSELTLVLVKSKLTDKKVSWWDTSFPC